MYIMKIVNKINKTVFQISDITRKISTSSVISRSILYYLQNVRVGEQNLSWNV